MVTLRKIYKLFVFSYYMEFREELTDMITDFLRRDLGKKGLTFARDLFPGEIFRFLPSVSYDGVVGDYFKVISNDTRTLKPGCGTPNIRCVPVEFVDDNYIPRRDGVEFSICDLDRVKLVNYRFK